VPGTISRYARYWRIADPRDDEAAMIEGLIDLARRLDRPPVILTGCDQHAQALARHRDRLREVALPCIARSEVVELLVHKGRFSAWAQAHVPSYPRSVPATQFRPGGPVSFPVVAKPNHRGFANAAKLDLPSEEELHERRFTLIRNKEEWEAYRERQGDYLSHLLIQQYVTGTSASKYSVCIYADRHAELRAVFVGRRLRGYPALYGDATLVQSDDVPDTVLAEVTDIVRELGYEGIAEIEFNRDDVTGEFHLLEVNPRCWAWIGITAVTDCNVPWIAYQDLTGRRPAGTVYGPEPGVTKILFLVQDAANVFLRYRWSYPDWVMSPRAWRRSLQAARLVIWEFDRRDWRGTAACILLIACKALRYVWRGLAGRLRTVIGRDGHPSGSPPS
jgi:predicted ATP-grasp superfamily ATP-dependent carboligase